jgi:hypothetical protein
VKRLGFGSFLRRKSPARAASPRNLEKAWAGLGKGSGRGKSGAALAAPPRLLGGDRRERIGLVVAGSSSGRVRVAGKEGWQRLVICDQMIKARAIARLARQGPDQIASFTSVCAQPNR